MIKRLKPGIPKRFLLFVAAIVWAVASLMLLFRGAGFIFKNSNYKFLHFLAAIVFGVSFYRILFNRISKKHIERIKSINIEKPCIFSFFNFRSYLLMGLMISLGISLRKFNLVNPDYLYTFYVGMGIPLFISSLRFYFAWLQYSKRIN